MFYYIIPKKDVVQHDYEKEIDVIIGIEPSVKLTGKWVGDCKDGENYLIKTDTEIAGLQSVAFDSEEVIAIGFDPLKVQHWNGGW